VGHAAVVTAPLCLREEVRSVPGWPGLAVSRSGHVYGPRGPRKPGPHANGYLYVSARLPGRLWPAKLAVHTAVLLAWVGPKPEGQEGRHKNGMLTDNTLSNLAWSTHVENVADKELHGTVQRGERNGRAKLTEHDVRVIRAARPGTSLAELGERYGVSRTCIYLAATGRTWKGLG